MTIDTYLKSLVLNRSEIEKSLRTDPLWYLDNKIEKLINNIKTKPKNCSDKDWENTKEQFKNWAQKLLEEDKILLGQRDEFFNDDDRKTITTAVIHHTSSKQNVDYKYINSTHLLNLYYPIYKNGFGKINNNFQPISSGHYYKGKQTFVGYHYLVYENGTVENILKDEYVGFHAGDYLTNCKSIGIAVVDDLLNKVPSDKAIESIKQIIKKYSTIKEVIGHKQVMHVDKLVDTSCPGNKWEEWKGEIII